MQVHVSNRMEALVGVLADLVAAGRGGGGVDPIAPETIAVQGRGMERWLSMELSRRLGVWANPSFPFPRRLIESAFDAVLGPADASASRFEPESLRWSVAALLPEIEDRDELRPLRRMRSDSPLRRLQLATRVADVLDRYVTYRPEMIRAWERGTGEGAPSWQASLWRELVRRHGGQHLAARAEAFFAAIGSAPGALSGLPPRIHLFGVTTLPPLYLDVLAALSEHVELHVYWLGCTRSPEEDANALWSSMGSVARESHQLLRERVGTDAIRETFEAPDDVSMLGALQRAELAGEGAPAAPRLVAESDRSIQVHACYGPMREVEVLHDQLTALFESDPTLEPRDVVVMTPDVEAYAPFIEAVFSGGSGSPSERPQLGHRIADRGVRATHEIVDGFSQLLEALRGRLGASAVVDLLMVDCIRRRFGIEAPELEVVSDWIQSAGIRWGVDADHRAEVGQPRVAQNTWREGLDRLLLGVALPGDDAHLYRGHLPARGVEPSRVDLLGRLADFCEQLFLARERLSGERSVGDWSRELARVLDAMIDRDGSGSGGAEQHARIRSALADIARRAKDAGFREDVGVAVMLHELIPRLEQGVPSRRFLTGGVTFCEMIPMRSIPFRVVVLLGMDDEAFPRSREPAGFDLTARDRRCGDRSPRDDDRYLFLEAIVSARDHLLVTYTGRCPRDGSQRAPSVVVSELLDELSARFAPDCAEDADGALRTLRDRIVTLHPRHPFSPRYFDGRDSSLVSYSRSDCDGARALAESRAAPRPPRAPFVREPLPDERSSSHADRVVELDRLARFFEHPTRSFLQQRLGLYLRDEVPDLEDREPAELDPLASWKIGNALLHHDLAGLPPEHVRAVLRASGELPFGEAGELEIARCESEVAKLAVSVRALRQGDPRPPAAVDLSIGDWQIVGELGDLWPAGRVVFQYSRLPHRAELGFWVRHLVLNCLAPGEDERPRESFLVARARDRRGERVSVVHLPAVPDAASRLHELIGLFERGRSVPLPLLPRTSRAQADFGARKGWPDEVAAAAVGAWETDRPLPAERDDPYLHQAFGDLELLEPGVVLPGGDDFASLARSVYEPYLSSREDWL